MNVIAGAKAHEADTVSRLTIENGLLPLYARE
jgi:hypothetical protein